MIKVEENKRINEDLKKLYKKNTAQFLELWKKHFKSETAPKYINEFGIIDPEKFDTEKRILVIGKETNGESWWKPNIYSFLKWLKEDVINKKDFPKHPNMWYVVGRLILLLENEDMYISINASKDETINALSRIAFTNINKIGGYNQSDERYRGLSQEQAVIKILIQEIEIIKPEIIILCDEYFAYTLFREYIKLDQKSFPQLKKCIVNNRFYTIPHPAARKSTEKMLQYLKEQLNK